MKRLCVFWRENKGASVVEMRFGPCYFLQAQFFPAVQMYLRGTMEDGIFSKWKKVNNLSIDHFPSACSQSIAASVPFCRITSYFHTVLPVWLKEKLPVALITTPCPLQLLKNGSNLGFGENARWGTNEAPQVACSRAVLSFDLESFVVCRREEELMVRIAVGYISERPRCRGVGRSKDLSTN